MNILKDLTLGAAALLLFCSCSHDGKERGCQVVLVSPSTGELAALGREIHRARELVESELSSLTNLQVRIHEVDSASTPAVARAEVARAVDKWKPTVVVGSIVSGETREFLSYVLEAGIVVIANGSSDPGIRDLPYRRENDGFFRNWPADDFEAEVMARYLRSSNRAARLVVLHANDPYATALASSFAKRFVAEGGEIVGTEVYPLDLSSFDGLIKRQPTDGHDGYYVIGFPPDVAAVYNTIRRIEETSDANIYSAAGANTGEFLELANKPVDRLFFTAPEVDEAAGPYFDMRRRYQTRYDGEDPDIVTAITYDALRIAIHAIDTASCEPDQVKNFLHSDFVFEGTTGRTGFNQFGDVYTKAVVIQRYEMGRKLLIEKRSAVASR